MSNVIDFDQLRQEHADGYSGPDPATEREAAQEAADLEAVHADIYDAALTLFRSKFSVLEVVKLTLMGPVLGDTDCYTKLNAICCAYDARMKEGE